MAALEISSGDRDDGLRVVSVERDQLGEGPVWHDRDQALLRVDISNGRVLALGRAGQPSTTLSVRAEVSAAIPRATGGMLLALGHELVAVDRRGRRSAIAIVEDSMPDNRFNDCRCDSRGRLWAGTMSKRRVPGTAALYRLVPGEAIERVVANTTISNGIAWSPADDRMYFVDSTTQRIDAFDFDAERGLISNRRPFARIDPADGLPDGMTVDADGGVWICLFGGAAIRRYGEDGRLEEEVRLPVTNPTCPTFGGPGLRTLYVTSARHRLSPQQLAGEPLAGAVLAFEPGVAGLPANLFAG